MVTPLLRQFHKSVDSIKSIRTLLSGRLPQLQLQNQPQDPPFIPFSQLQDAKSLLESQLVSLLDGCTQTSQLKQVHARIYRAGLHQCCYVLTKLIRMLISCGVPMVSYSMPIFHTVDKPNPFLYTALIRGYSIQGPFKESVSLYRSMRERGIGPVSFTFTAIFKACSANLDICLGRQMHAQMVLVGGFECDLYVGNCLIDMYVTCRDLGCARKMFDEMPVKDLISWTTLISAYTKYGDMASAGDLFGRLPVKDLVVWTAMVTGFAQNAKPREALKFFEKMQDEGIGSDEVTLVGVISACAQLGAAKYAKWVLDIAEEIGLSPTENVVVGSAMIDMYSKCGEVMDAYKIFEGMTERNVYTYSSMILGFAMHGHPNAAMQLFSDMSKTDIKPNDVTFIGVITACSHGGMVEQGREIFASMEKHYGVPPNAEHYACMVDLLGRAGLLEEALELINEMPLKPHGGVWGALLGACRVHGNADVAEIAAQHLFVLEPDAIANYILLSNIYASSGRWNDVLRMRKLMRGKGMRKKPGSSWFEAKKGEIHEFFAGDMTHPRSTEIKQVLDDLLQRLQVHGYRPNLSSVVYDVSDDDKKRILSTHSEKLALAFGLLSSSTDSTITIVKNLRICEDCHSFMCSASQVTGRQIVVRDNMRFHHFRDGSCSCGNFW